MKEVNHASSGRFSRSPETFVIVKVEDAFKGRTKATRNDKWADELHHIEIDKANEIELTVYDKSGTYPTPIGMLWIRISDLVEEMRRKKIESELSGSNWVTAEQMDKSPGGRGDGGYGHGHSQSHGGGGFNMDPSSGGPKGMAPSRNQPGSGDENDPNIIEAWFSLEPVGSIKLTMSFGKIGQPALDK